MKSVTGGFFPVKVRIFLVTGNLFPVTGIKNNILCHNTFFLWMKEYFLSLEIDFLSHTSFSQKRLQCCLWKSLGKGFPVKSIGVYIKTMHVGWEFRCVSHIYYQILSTYPHPLLVIQTIHTYRISHLINIYWPQTKNCKNNNKYKNNNNNNSNNNSISHH